MQLGRLATGFATYAAANFIHRGAIFLAVPAFTRLLSPVDYGRWTLVLATYAIANLFFDFGISRGVPRLYMDRGSSEIKAFVSSSMSLRLVLSILMAVVFWFVGGDLVTIAAGRDIGYSHLTAAVICLCICESITSFNLALLRARELAGPYMWTRLTGTALQLLLGITLINAVPDPLVGLTWGYAIGSAVATCVSILFVVRALGFFPRLKRLPESLRLLAYGAPLVFHDLGTWFRSSADPFLLARFASLAEVSIYSLATMSGLAIALLAFSFELAYAPYFYRTLQNEPEHGRKKVVNVASAYLAAMGIVAAVPILFSQEIYGLLVPVQYSAAARYAPVISLSYFIFVIYTIEVKPLFFHKKTMLVPVITLLPTFLGVITNYLVLPFLGMASLPWVWLVCFSLMALAAKKTSSRYDTIEFGKRLPVCLVAFLLVLVLTLPVLQQLDTASSLIARLSIFTLIALVLGTISRRHVFALRSPQSSSSSA